jgi:hypothetical protein
MKIKRYKYKGVAYQDKRYVSKITHNKKVKYIGMFMTKYEALKARNDYIEENNLPHKRQTYIAE